MRQQLYEELCDALRQPTDAGHRLVDMAGLSEVARRMQPKVSYDTLLSIYNQLHQTEAKEIDSAMKTGLRTWLREYEEGTTMAAIALREGFSPCNLARLMLRHLVDLPDSKQASKDVTLFIRDPSLLPCCRLSENVRECVELDWQNSPRAEVTKRTVGLEYEYVLAERLSNAGLAFSTEDKLRGEGKAVTPDVKLVVPVSINGHVVHWIDSKAMFGSEETHVRYTEDQYQRYVNRYGDGMVIYWFDFVDHLNWDDASESSGASPLTVGRDSGGLTAQPATTSTATTEMANPVAHPGVYCVREFPLNFLLPT
jgi:hypothetical protein